MTDDEKKRKFIINIAYYALLIAMVLLAFRYAMGVCFPIIFAFFVATVLQRPKNYILKKTPLKKGLASTLCVISLLVVAKIFVGIIVNEIIKSNIIPTSLTVIFFISTSPFYFRKHHYFS